ncbi:hypothetical protein T492DRAFT_1043453 [Pavlovales sp. CCMP2436]|nr:hypothetical protein T492DRAFT_1043453 [Pavlovales sp. CCMP2436]
MCAPSYGMPQQMQQRVSPYAGPPPAGAGCFAGNGQCMSAPFSARPDAPSGARPPTAESWGGPLGSRLNQQQQAPAHYGQPSPQQLPQSSSGYMQHGALALLQQQQRQQQQRELGQYIKLEDANMLEGGISSFPGCMPVRVGSRMLVGFIAVPKLGTFALQQTLCVIMEALTPPQTLAQNSTALVCLMQGLVALCNRTMFPRLEHLRAILHAKEDLMRKALGHLTTLAFKFHDEVAAYREHPLFHSLLTHTLVKLKLLKDFEVSTGTHIIPFWDATVGMSAAPNDARDTSLLADSIRHAPLMGCMPPLLAFVCARLKALIVERCELAPFYMGAAPILRVLGAILKCENSPIIIVENPMGPQLLSTLLDMGCKMILGDNSVLDLLAAMAFEVLALAAAHPMMSQLNVQLAAALSRQLGTIIPSASRQANGRTGQPRPILPRLSAALCCLYAAIQRGGAQSGGSLRSMLILASGGDEEKVAPFDAHLLSRGQPADDRACKGKYHLLPRNRVLPPLNPARATHQPASDSVSADCKSLAAKHVEHNPRRCHDAACSNRRLLGQRFYRVNQAEGHLVAGEQILAGALVLEARGEICAESLDFAETLDVLHAGSLAVLITHSPKPNCEFQAWLADWRPRIGVYALCGIAQGAVLTVDYSVSTVGQGTTALPSWCSSALVDAVRTASPPPTSDAPSPRRSGAQSAQPATSVPTLAAPSRTPSSGSAARTCPAPAADPPAAPPWALQREVVSSWPPAAGMPPGPPAGVMLPVPGAGGMPVAARNPITAFKLAAVAKGDWGSRPRNRVLIVGAQGQLTDRKQEWNRAKEGALVALILLKRKAIDPLTAYGATKRQRGTDDSTSRLTGAS